MTLRVLGGDGSSWLKAPDGWILECNSPSMSPLYSMIAVSESSSSEDTANTNSERDRAAQEQQHHMSGEKAPLDSNRKSEPVRASPAVAAYSERESAEVESSPSKADASGARMYSRDHQRNSRLFEQFESKRPYSQPDQSNYSGGEKSPIQGESRDSPAEQPFPLQQSEVVASSASGQLSPVAKSLAKMPPFSSIIDCSEEGAAQESFYTAKPASRAAPAEASSKRVVRGAESTVSEEEQIEECLHTLQSLLARDRGPQYDELHEAIASTSNKTSQSGKQGAGKLQRLAQMQTHMKQVAGNLVALSSNVLQCQQTLEKLIAGEIIVVFFIHFQHYMIIMCISV